MDFAPNGASKELTSAASGKAANEIDRLGVFSIITSEAIRDMLAFEKQGFVAYQKDVQIEPGKLVEERATLVPSPDFIKDYESRQGKLRLGAWATTGAAVAGIALAIWAQVDANRLYGNETTPDTFLFARRKLLDGDESFRAQATTLKSDVEQRQLLSAVGAGVGGAAAIAAAYFWVAGDDPNRYGRYREGSARIDVVPLAGGAFASLTLGF